jgi:uncharacterized protein (TIGR00730 family)
MILPRVTVFGSSRATSNDPVYAEAVRLGRLLAEGGYAVCTGGYSGLMEAVSRGAAEAGGRVVGVTVKSWASRIRPNAWLGEEIATEHLFERLLRLTESDAYVALSGGLGTLGEVALAWNLLQTESIPVRPLILVGHLWPRLVACLKAELRVEPRDFELVQFAESVDGVVPLLAGHAISRGPDPDR